MKLQHSKTNYNFLQAFLKKASDLGGYAQFRSGGYMPLSVESLHYRDSSGREMWAISHTGVQMGDLMRDPEVTFGVGDDGTIVPHTFLNDYMSIYQDCFIATGIFNARLMRELDEFLWQWLKNIKDQGFNPASGIPLSEVVSFE